MELEWSSALVESVLRLELTGNAGAPVVVLPSVSKGPTSLTLPLEVNLQVGLELSSLARLVVLDGAGAATTDYDLPLNPALSGLALRAQALEIPTTSTVVEHLSEAIQATVGVIGSTHLLAEPVLAPRRFHTATELLDGRVLIAGGTSPDGTSGWPTSLEWFDPQTGLFTASAATLPVGRAHHTATLLDDGRVLLVGGVRPGGNVHGSALLYDPVADSLTPPVSQRSPRVRHTAHLLPDGDVLVIGGSEEYSLGHPFGFPLTLSSLATNSVERFDAGTTSFVAAAQLPTPRFLHASATLGDGRVLVTGGVIPLAGGGAQTVADARAYDSAANAWAPIGPLPAPRALHAMTGTEAGGALVVGGGEIDFTVPLSYSESTTGWVQADLSMPGWDPIPDEDIIVSDGRVVCVPREEVPIGPIVTTGATDLLEGPPVYYYGGSGYASVNLSTGATVANDRVERIGPNFLGWEKITPVLESRVGESFTVLSGSLRVLRIGAGASTVDPGGEVTVLAWPTVATP